MHHLPMNDRQSDLGSLMMMIMMMMMMMMMIMMINYFCGMVDQWKALTLLPAGPIIRDSDHRKPQTCRERNLNLRKTRV